MYNLCYFNNMKNKNNDYSEAYNWSIERYNNGPYKEGHPVSYMHNFLYYDVRMNRVGCGYATSTSMDKNHVYFLTKEELKDKKLFKKAYNSFAKKLLKVHEKA